MLSTWDAVSTLDGLLSDGMRAALGTAMSPRAFEQVLTFKRTRHFD